MLLFKAFVMWRLWVGYVGVESRTDQLIFIAGLVFWQIRCSDFLQHLWGYVSHEDDEQGGRESLDGCCSRRVKKTLLDNQPMGATPMMMLRRNLHWEKQFPSKDCVLRHHRKLVQLIRVGVSLKSSRVKSFQNQHASVLETCHKSQKGNFQTRFDVPVSISLCKKLDFLLILII